MKRAIFRKGLVIIFLLILMMNFFPITIISEQKSNDYSSSNLLASSPLEYAYKCDRLSHIDENYGNPQAIYVVKNYFSTIAFIADNSGGLVIVDVTDSEDPQFISQLSGMVARYIYVSHQTAYVGTNEDVKVIDVSDLKHPRLRKTLDIPLVNAINGKDDLLVVSALFNGAIFFDISSPSNPVEINGYLGSSVYYDMILYENYLFLCHTSLTILDVSNPSSYSVVSQISVGCPFNSRIFLYEDWIFVFGLSAGIFLIDVSDYSNPLIVDQYNDSGLDYISGFVKNDILYSLTEERLELFELGDFSTIEGSDVLPLSIKYDGLFFFSNIAYIYDSLMGFDIFSPGNTAENSLFLGSFRDGVTTEGITIYNNQIFLESLYNGFSSYDITNPFAPIKISSSPANRVYYRELAAAYDRLFAFNFQTRYMDVYNISNPTVPPEMMINESWNISNQSPWWSKTVIAESKAFVLQNYVFIANHPILHVYNLSNFENITLISDFLLDYSIDFKIQGEILCSIDHHTLYIYDIANLNNVQLVANLTYEESYFNELTISDDRVFLADKTYGLRIIDISNPSNPVEIGAYQSAQSGVTDSGATQVALEGDILYLCDTNDGLLFIDISNITQPEKVGQYYYVTSEIAIENERYGINLLDVAVENTIVCLAANEDGLLIVHLNSLPLPYNIVFKRNIIIISSTISLLLLLGGIFIVIFLVKRKKSNDDEKKKESKKERKKE